MTESARVADPHPNEPIERARRRVRANDNVDYSDALEVEVERLSLGLVKIASQQSGIWGTIAFEALHDKGGTMTPPRYDQCPNCVQHHGARDECFLGMLLGVLEDRIGTLTPQQINLVYEHVNVDYLWDVYGGPAVDVIESYVQVD